MTKKENSVLKETKTRALCITDLTTLVAKQILEIKLSHCNIEVSHWILDVQYKQGG